jgi:hypothetical protein
MDVTALPENHLITKVFDPILNMPDGSVYFGGKSKLPELFLLGRVLIFHEIKYALRITNFCRFDNIKILT